MNGKRRLIVMISAACLALAAAGTSGGCDNLPVPRRRRTQKTAALNLRTAADGAYEGTLRLTVLPAFVSRYKLEGLRFIDDNGTVFHVDYVPQDSFGGTWKSGTPVPRLTDVVLKLRNGTPFWLPVIDIDGNRNFVTSAIPISGIEEFDAIRGGDEYPLDRHYVQIAAIDFAGAHGWEPVGGAEQPFTGTFDGGFHAVNNLKVEKNHGAYQAGLFGVLGEEGRLQNIQILNGSVLGASNTGGVCGESYGEITRCLFMGTVRGFSRTGGVAGLAGGGVIRSCAFEGEVSASRALAGGIAGLVSGGAVIRDCSNSGTIFAPDRAGGIAGGGNGVVFLRCANRGSIQGLEKTGGIAGEITAGGAVIGCDNTGGVSGNTGSGGIAGRLEHSAVRASRNQGKVSAKISETGGITGSGFHSGISASYNTGGITGGAKAGGIIGRNEGAGDVFACYNNSVVTGIYGSARGWIIGDNTAGTGEVAACYWYGAESPEINGIGAPPSRANAKPFGSGSGTPADPWPQAAVHSEWGTGNGGGGKSWKSLGSWNNGNPVFPRLYWEATSAS
jgi:hypothetical protein